MKTFNKKGIKASLFVIFTSGGIDFVGGYSFYQFLKAHLFQEGSSIDTTARKLGTLKLTEQTGEEIHEKIFQRNEVKYPNYWKQIVSYF